MLTKLTPAQINAPVTELMQIPLAQLRHGADVGLNVRKTGRDRGVDEMAASLRAHAYQPIEPLVVLAGTGADDGLYFVAAGDRRLSGLRRLQDLGEIAETHLVDVVVRRLDVSSATDISLAENVTRAPLHPVDQYEAFAKLSAEGLDEADIAARYSLTERQVRQNLALGALSDAVRSAWREGLLGADEAQAFTLAKSHKVQDKLLAKVKKEERWSAFMIRRELGCADDDIGGLVDFVGLETCAAAGVDVTPDLFGSNHIVSDAAKLKQLAGDRLEAECVRLVQEDGWAWAITRASLPKDYYSWKRSRPEKQFTPEEKRRHAELVREIARTEENDDWDREQQLQDEINALDEAAELRGYTPRQKEKAGCVVSIENGRIDIDYGLIRPASAGSSAAAGKSTASPNDDGAKSEKAKPKPENKDPAKISDALTLRLSEQFTRACSEALAAEPDVALTVLLAGFASETSPICVSVSGMVMRLGPSPKFTASRSFETNLETIGKMSRDDRLLLLADVAAAALDMRIMNHHGVAANSKKNLAIADRLKPASIEKALGKAFDAKDYFGAVNKAQCLTAIAEALGKDEAEKLAGAGKADIVKVAIARVPQSGWLPPALRIAHYAGPGSAGKLGGQAAKSKKRGTR
jgi:ParB family chromosome partitioning protein